MIKNKYFVFPIVCIAFLFSVVSSTRLFAQSQGHERVVAPSVGKPESEGAKIVSGFKFKPLNFIPPKVDRVVLENGMILYLLEDHDLPLFNITARIRTGAIYEPQEKAGLASLTGYVMRSGGTIAMPPDKMNEEIEFMAASVETSIDRESGSASLSTLKKDIDKGLKIFADVLMNPAFPEDKIKMRKDEVIESIRRENDNPTQIAHREFRRILYDSKHPYSRKIDGTLESIEKITRDDMVAFHKKFFHPNNIILGISGDFNKEEIIKKLDAVFAGWKKEDTDFPEVPKVEKRFEKSVYYVYKDINQANVIMGHLGIHRKSPDYFPVMIMNFILGGGSFTARIPGRIRSDEGLAYSAFSAFQTARDLGIFFVSCQTKLESTNRAISIALEEIDKIRKAPIDKEELALAKETFMNQFVFRFMTSASIVAQKVDIEYEDLPLNYFETYLDKVQSVTQEDVQRVARKYLHPDEIKILVVGDKEKFDKPLDSFGKVNIIELK
ncbi:MAG: putative peptidase [Candidatus Brocadia sinica]|uniref:Peptidase M16 domain-containing protein n=1 Tax=Candidatus Brocadia sinica JPN1 TaxID=1197129 RepID=A0ABQ0JT18_9BACT|nr:MULTISPECIES: pitrilysin family protein [Brocadia]KXK30574.1 MAG: putative peptidase [Candidatus Brocadia sinica]NOG43444.1 insulinase family protein [Planctomycetota bacterium]MCK6468775.1 insulinase family protein [Candidatus Brocadia sinica]NUO03961.1 insulinase family protein [Candidatus Brocadia sinica]GAN31863.1 peptidase M16 domain-containing protein [Candidatus Brocadia sinica JPN1]